jgi:hypothetical protein
MRIFFNRKKKHKYNDVKNKEKKNRRVCVWRVFTRVAASRMLFSLVWAATLLGSACALNAFPLVLCTGLNVSQAHLRALEVSAHVFPNALLEVECVHVDACAALNERGQTVPRGAWLWRNDSALWLAGNDSAVHDGVEGARAHNWHSLEFARVPEGLAVRACEPDFSALRLHGELKCAAGTEVVIDSGLGAPACPSTGPYTLLDCMRSLQAHPVVERLPFRTKTTRMAFGSQTWYSACLAGGLSAEAQELCALLERSYELRLPLATTTSRVQLVRYDFSTGFGCFGAADVGAGTRLSRATAPNTVVACPAVAHGAHAVSADPTKCAFACDAGYTQTATACELGCTVNGSALTRTACDTGEYARAQCDGNGVAYYGCAACAEVPGSAAAAWTAASPSACEYTPCAAGEYGRANTCAPCPAHHYAPRANMSACLPCDANATGLYQPLTGQTACTACFAAAPTGTCAPGQARVASYDEIKAYFARTGLHVHEDMTAYCEQGHACLPCAPGSFETGAACAPCALGTYQPHYESTACFACSRGQSTGREGATDASECVCQPGFE